MKIQTIYLLDDGYNIRASIPYQYKDICKSVPGRRWDDMAKQWVFPASQVDVLRQLLESQGVFVEVVEVNPPPIREHTATKACDWAAALFTEIGCEKAPWLFRRLSQSLHPDMGGDTRLQQQLNDGYRSCCGGSGQRRS